MVRKIFVVVLLLACTLSLMSQLPGEQTRVNNAVSGMSLKEKVGQLLVYSLPVNANSKYKRSLEQVIKEYNIGGVVYSYGNIADQIALVKSVQRRSSVPLLLSVDAELGMPAYIKGAPDFPRPAALNSITDARLLEMYGKEIAREYGVLGVHTDALPEGMVPVNAYTIAETQKNLLDSISRGALTGKEIDDRCRKVLAAKYALGVGNPHKMTPAKKLAGVVITPQALELAKELRLASVTVLGNEPPVIPMIKENIAVLCIGDEGSDSAFLAAIKKHADIKVYRLTNKDSAGARGEIARELKNFRRVIVSLTTDMLDARLYRRFLSELTVPAPLTYVAFSSHSTLRMLAEPLKKASAVVLAHTASEDVQAHVADVLFARATANGKLSADIGGRFLKGDGIEVTEGMQPGGVVPEDYGMNSFVLYNELDKLIGKAIENGDFPGCQVSVYKNGKSVYNKCFGTRSGKDATAVSPTDMYDIGTLTETTATLLAVMKLYDEGKLRLESRVADYLPLFRATDKADITIRELLLHESGLHPYIRFYQMMIDDNSVHGPFFQGFEDEWHHTRSGESTYASSDFRFMPGLMSERETSSHTMHMAEGMWVDNNFRHTMMKAIADSEREGRRLIHSQLGFLLLQQVVEEITRMPLDKYLDREFYAPMGLTRTLFLPLRKYGKEEVMPTVESDYLRRQDLRGYVHNEVAACLGGVAGNAGLFSTSTEVAQLYLMLLNGGEYKGKRYLSEETCRLFTTEKSGVSHKGLGFDKPNVEKPLENACSASTPAEAFGGAGFMGNCVWADPVNNVVYVFLSNRMCPHAWNLTMIDSKLREKVQEVIYSSMKP